MVRKPYFLDDGVILVDPDSLLSTVSYQNVKKYSKYIFYYRKRSRQGHTRGSSRRQQISFTTTLKNFTTTLLKNFTTTLKNFTTTLYRLKNLSFEELCALHNKLYHGRR